MAIQTKAFKSTHVVRAAYDDAAQTLDVEFKSGDTYRYFLVPKTVAIEFFGAPSAGGFVRNVLTDSYRYEQI